MIDFVDIVAIWQVEKLGRGIVPPPMETNSAGLTGLGVSDLKLSENPA